MGRIFQVSDHQQNKEKALTLQQSFCKACEQLDHIVSQLNEIIKAEVEALFAPARTSEHKAGDTFLQLSSRSTSALKLRCLPDLGK
jgi:hypothetical protein